MKPMLLIAEGDAELGDFYRKFLTRHDYEVATASNGLDCLAKLRQLEPAVLVLDLELLWGGGDGVLGWLRERSAASAIAVVLTATNGYATDVAEEIGPPVVRFLRKPFTLVALLECVRTASESRHKAASAQSRVAAGAGSLAG